jgi:hypothetical protein
VRLSKLVSYCNKSIYTPNNRMTAHMGAIIVWTCLVFHVFFLKRKGISQKSMMPWCESFMQVKKPQEMEVSFQIFRIPTNGFKLWHGQSRWKSLRTCPSKSRNQLLKNATKKERFEEIIYEIIWFLACFFFSFHEWTSIIFQETT